MLYFGKFGSYEEYYAFGNNPEEVKKILWRMYCRNCYITPHKEERQTFEEEHHITAVELPPIEKAYGFNSADGCGRIFTLNGNHLVIVKEVSE